MKRRCTEPVEVSLGAVSTSSTTEPLTSISHRENKSHRNYCTKKNGRSVKFRSAVIIQTIVTIKPSQAPQF